MRSSFRSALRSIRQSWEGLTEGAELLGALLVLTLQRAFGQPRDRRDFGGGVLVPVPVRPSRPVAQHSSRPHR
ncbi:MAG: hypothetical protein JSR82_04435 [Verrucomicrobia bacterium]|nr:hypothetical protein [Verrucomicrobiota bacterium]